VKSIIKKNKQFETSLIVSAYLYVSIHLILDTRAIQWISLHLSDFSPVKLRVKIYEFALKKGK